MIVTDRRHFRHQASFAGLLPRFFVWAFTVTEN